MATAFLGLVQQVVALLAAAPAIADEVTLNRQTPVPRPRGSLINVVLDLSKGQRAAVAAGPMDFTTRVAVEIYRQHDTGTEGAAAVDPYLQAAYERLIGQGSALALGVEEVLPDPDIAWDFAEGDKPVASVTFSVLIVHRTEALTLAPRN